MLGSEKGAVKPTKPAVGGFRLPPLRRILGAAYYGDLPMPESTNLLASGVLFP